MPVLATGIAVGAFVVVFRIMLGTLLYGIPIDEGFMQHMPVFFIMSPSQR